MPKRNSRPLDTHEIQFAESQLGMACDYPANGQPGFIPLVWTEEIIPLKIFAGSHKEFFDTKIRICLRDSDQEYRVIEMVSMLYEGIREPIVITICARGVNTHDGAHRLSAAFKRKDRTIRAYVGRPAEITP